MIGIRAAMGLNVMGMLGHLQGPSKTAFTITGSSSGTFSVTPEGTVDDLMLSSSSVWVALSSAALSANFSSGRSSDRWLESA